MDDYIDKQKQRDAQYARAWETLTPAQRRQMAKHGITGPELPRYHTCKPDDEGRMEDITDNASGFAEQEPEGAQSQPPSQHESGDALASFCARIRGSANPLMQFDAACFAAGLGDLEGKTETELAKRHGVTRAAFSKAVINWCDTFALRPSPGMKSRNARALYRKAQLTKNKKV